MSTTKIIQYIHRPNNTELGKGNTHESYMLIPSNIDVSSIFPSSVEVVVTDSISGKKYRLKSASGKEFRVNQMGDFYRDYSVNQGDEIIITNVNNGTDNKRFISIRKFERVAIITSSKGSEIINIEKLDDCKQSDGSYHITLYQNGMYSTMKISFLSSQRKRSDSPNTTDYYNVAINGNPITVGTHYITLGQKNTFSDLQKCEYSEVEFDDLNFLRSFIPTGNVNTKPHIVPTLETTSQFRPLLTAIRTKPFILLAGISGTGKSRIVRELAFKSCPKYLQDEDHTTPGNYCMIEVKPNWHDSTELLGYYSNINKGYQFKKFVNFLVKAKMFPDVPFFVCLDEMNLAPVEHYFAEILSILETRKNTNNGIKTDVIIEKKYFKELSFIDENGATRKKVNMSDKEWFEEFFGISDNDEAKSKIQKFQYSRTLQEVGLTLPGNVIIIGTVNMDDTTHQFSRKVIDRAMTIEMNGGNLSDMFGGSKNLDYLTDEDEQKKWQSAFLQPYINADEVLDAHPDEAEEIKKQCPQKIEQINAVLKGTPFEVSYRVLNELVIITGVMLDCKNDGESIDTIINKAIDNIMLMKVLPRIEGDEEMFAVKDNPKNRLEQLMDLMPDIATSDNRQTAKTKIKEMNDRLGNQGFTRFWP